MKIERIKISELTPDPHNARTHDEANLKAIAGSLSEFGQRKPIVITQDNKVVAGNGTLTAAKLIGWTEIDCVRVPADWTADRIKAYALADNRTAELAQWDINVLDAQLSELRLVDFDLGTIGFDFDTNYENTDWSGLSDAVKDKSDFEQMTFVLSEFQADLVKQAIAKAKLKNFEGDGLNQNSNGNALHFIVKRFLEL